jgi:hypothetical protein
MSKITKKDKSETRPKTRGQRVETTSPVQHQETRLPATSPTNRDPRPDHVDRYQTISRFRCCLPASIISRILSKLAGPKVETIRVLRTEEPGSGARERDIASEDMMQAADGIEVGKGRDGGSEGVSF